MCFVKAVQILSTMVLGVSGSPHLIPCNLPKNEQIEKNIKESVKRKKFFLTILQLVKLSSDLILTPNKNGGPIVVTVRE